MASRPCPAAGAASARSATSNATRPCRPARRAKSLAILTACASRSLPRMLTPGRAAAIRAMPAARRSRASATSACQARASWPRQRRNPKAGAFLPDRPTGPVASSSARSSPGATSAAMRAASMGSVPDPQSGSSRLPPAAATLGHAAYCSTPAARFSLSGASTCTLSARYPRRCRLCPLRSSEIVTRPPARCTLTRTSGARGSTEGRVPPLCSRSWSTMASLTRTAPYCVSRMRWLVPLKSTASVSSGPRCSLQSTRRAVAYSSSPSPPAPVVRGRRIRPASRDQRQARYAISRGPAKDTPARTCLTCAAPRPRSSPASSDSSPRGTDAKRGRSTIPQGYHAAPGRLP